ncbi:MAG: hypothetical protein LBG06_04560 [Deltaproteobacteria bacterium]|nr:hypothetical protein [Deltaproteobacteria bacterium]
MTDGDGRFGVLLVPEPGVREGILAVSAGDAARDFPVGFGGAGPGPGWIRVIYVGEEPGNVFVFRVIDRDGRGVPGRRVEFSVSRGIPVVDPGTGRERLAFASDGEGYIRIGLRPSDPSASEAEVTARPEGGEGGDFTVPLDLALSLSARPLALAYPGAQRVVFSLLLNGERLAAGTPVRLEPAGAGAADLAGLPGEAAADAEGRVAAPALRALRAGTLAPVRARAGGLLSNAVTFTAGGGGPGGPLALAADRDSLPYLAAAPAVFTVTLGGAPVPEGTLVTLEALEPGGLSGLGGIYAAGAGGRIAVPSLRAERPAGPLQVRAAALGLVSAPWAFAVTLQGELRLAASRDSLELFWPRRTVLYLTLGGSPLPEGVPVAFSFAADELEGLPPSAVTGPGGTVEADLAALRAAGAPAVSAAAAGLASNPVPFAVEMEDGMLAMAWILDPRRTHSVGGGPEEEYVLFPCEPYRGELTFSYRGRPLADTALAVRGAGYSAAGAVTDGRGTLAADLYLTAADAAGYLADPRWEVRAGGSVLHVQGPRPVSFISCGGL